MNQAAKKPTPVDQFFYQDRWVDKAHFRAFVYGKNGEQKLANSYQEFETLTTTGIWFASAPKKGSFKDALQPASK